MKQPCGIALVIELAEALDAEDYAAARATLGDKCLYEIRGETTIGGDAIIASYRSNGESARRRFDSVAYSSVVTPIAPGLARIEYTDVITHRGARHVHRCVQKVELDEDGGIARILHIDLPGEIEALERFKQQHPP
jgi:hypothetical protein